MVFDDTFDNLVIRCVTQHRYMNTLILSTDTQETVYNNAIIMSRNLLTELIQRRPVGYDRLVTEDMDIPIDTLILHMDMAVNAPEPDEIQTPAPDPSTALVFDSVSGEYTPIIEVLRRQREHNINVSSTKTYT